MLPKQLVILGGGSSVTEGIEKGLFNLLPNLFTCGLNYSYRFVQTTFNAGVDGAFYNNNQKDIDKLPLYIGKIEDKVNKPQGNSFWFPPNPTYNRDLIGGVYNSTLVGLFILSIFIKLMDEGEIYLLGYDYGPARTAEGKWITDNKGRPLTHWYQGKIEHRGIGKVSWYTSTLIDSKDKKTRITQAEREFRVYKDESKVKIYNVGLSSAISTFPKIGYDEFFSKNLITVHNQKEVRDELRKRLKIVSAGITTNGKFAVPINYKIYNPKGPFDVK